MKVFHTSCPRDIDGPAGDAGLVERRLDAEKPEVLQDRVRAPRNRLATDEQIRDRRRFMWAGEGGEGGISTLASPSL